MTAEAAPERWLDRHGRPCPDPDAIRAHYAVDGCRTFVEPLPEHMCSTAGALMVDEGGSLSIILNSAEAPGGRLAALGRLHAALAEPTDPFVAWDVAGTGWMLVFHWRRSSENGAEAVDQVLAGNVGRVPRGARCLASVRHGGRCSRDGGWGDTGFCWQHFRRPSAGDLVSG